MDLVLHWLNVGLLVICVLLLAKYLPAYAQEKGKNLATKEDIATITDKMEAVRSVYAEKRESLAQQHRRELGADAQRHDLRLAVVAERFQAHQEAYSHWLSLYWASAGSDNDALRDAVNRAQEWWARRCLYLEPGVRRTFKVAIGSAVLDSNLLRRGDASSSYDDAHSKLVAAGQVIEAAVSLPSILDGEMLKRVSTS